MVMDNLKDKLDHFGMGVVNHFRDTNYEDYLNEKEGYTQVPLPELVDSVAASGMHDDLKAERIRAAKFFHSLSKEQSDFLDHWMLERLDQIAFNIMNVLDESRVDDSGLVVTIHGTDVTQLPLIGNGNMSGEYLDWIDRFSKYKRTF